MGVAFTTRGNLGDNPIPRLLVALRGREVTGSMEVREEALRTVLYLRRGCPVYIERPDARDRLDHILVDAGVVPARAIADAARTQAESGRLLGEILCQLGLVKADKLAEILALQLRRKLAHLFAASRATFEVVSTEHRYGRSESSPGIKLETRTLIFPCILETYDDARLGRELSSLSGAIVRLGPSARSALGDAGFPASANSLFSALANQGFRVEAGWVNGASGPRAREGKAILLTLHYLGLIEIQTLAPGAATPPAATAPRATASQPPRAPAVAPPVAAPTPDAPRPRRNSKVVKAYSEPVAARSSAEKAPPMKAAAPAARPEAPLNKKRVSWSRLDPKLLAKMAEDVYRHGDQRRAEEAFLIALKADPANPRVRAFLTWLEYWKPHAMREVLAVDAIKVFRDAVKADADFGHGHFFIGEMLKLKNDIPAAMASFREALRCDPGLLDAERELRLLTMRKPSAPAKKR